MLKKQFSISGNRISKLELYRSQSIPLKRFERFKNEVQQSLVCVTVFTACVCLHGKPLVLVLGSSALCTITRKLVI